MRQHERFLATHAEDDFSRQYMEWLGHYEFGAALRPIDFNGWIGRNPGFDPKTDTFWLTYWCEAFETILSQAGPQIHIVDYERACEEPEPVLSALGKALGLSDKNALLPEAKRFRASTRYERDTGSVDATLVSRVDVLYRQLREKAI